MPATSLQRRVTAEFLGTLFLVATVIGSGITAERLAGTNMALALLANTIATGAILVALIFTFGGISGAHFNPAVTVASRAQWRRSSIQRVRCHFRAACRDLGLFASPSQQCAVRGRGLHHYCVLVHFLNIVRESSSHYRKSGVRHVRRKSALLTRRFSSQLRCAVRLQRRS
jgi:Major intrinsic protein